MRTLPTIGFDAKRAAQNRTGLGNYSRFVIRAVSHAQAVNRLLLYVPNPHKTSALGDIAGERGVKMRFPSHGIWRWLRSLWRVWGVTSELVADGVGLYHGLSNELPWNIRKAKNVRSIVTIHDLIFLRYPHYYKPVSRWIYHQKFRRACKQADHIIAVSECTKRDIMHFFGTPENKISVIYQGCDERFRMPTTPNQREAVRVRYQLPPRFILYVGSIEERKNLMLLAKALPQLQDTNITVIAIGRNTSYANEVHHWIKSQGLSSRFRMLNNISSADLPIFYQLASVFVYPSRFEGFGIPMLEALCSGVPAIGCTGSCLEEAGGPSSCYVNPDDAQELANTIDRILADGELRTKMVNDGYVYAKRFETDALCKQLLNLYEEVVNTDICHGII